MRKYIFICLLITDFISVIAQDTVRYLDPWYRFKPMPILEDNYLPYGGAMYDEVIQMYPIENDIVKVYGVAMTVTDMSDEGNLRPEKVVLFRQLASGDPPMVEVVDSASYDEEVSRRCFFEYEYTLQQPHNRTVTCYEYYFNHPRGTIVPLTMTDTFYIGIYPSPEVRRSWVRGVTKNLYFEHGIYHNGGNYPAFDDWLVGWDNHLFIAGTQVAQGSWATITFFNANTVTNCTDCGGWGMMFPIVGLRCVAPWLRLVERGGGTATVSWSAAEAGVSYELSYGPFGSNPDTGSRVSTQDTFYTLTELEAGVREAVWVRKACIYSLEGGDTTVWSDWSAPLDFYTLGIGEVDETQVQVAVEGRQVVVRGAAGEEVRLYDLMGRQVSGEGKAEREEQRFAVPAAGVYVVRVGMHPARRVAVVR